MRGVIIVDGPGAGLIIQTDAYRIYFPTLLAGRQIGYVTYLVVPVDSYGEIHYEAHLTEQPC